MKRRLILLSLLIFFSAVLYPRWCGATLELRVTDVTTKAFSVVWLANQAATCSVKVYSDAQGTQRVSGITITNESALHPPAEDMGVMKVMVSGLELATTYYFQTVTTTAEGTLVEPSSGPLPSVKTEPKADIPNNDVLVHRILRSDGLTSALGALLVVKVEEGDYPVTGWVGDGYPMPWAGAELGNIYSKTNHLPLDLSGGQAITVESIGGVMGFRRLSATVPERIGGGSPQTLIPEPSSDQCTLDNTGPVIDSGQLSPVPRTFTSDDTPLIGGAYSDELSGVNPNSARLKVDGVDVTGQAVVNATNVAYVPMVPLSEGVHSVVLIVADE
jgi:hypothetical protein